MVIIGNNGNNVVIIVVLMVRMVVLMVRIGKNSGENYFYQTHRGNNGNNGNNQSHHTLIHMCFAYGHSIRVNSTYQSCINIHHFVLRQSPFITCVNSYQSSLLMIGEKQSCHDMSTAAAAASLILRKQVNAHYASWSK